MIDTQIQMLHSIIVDKLADKTQLDYREMLINTIERAKPLFIKHLRESTQKILKNMHKNHNQNI
jgi:hypothetical protein